MGLSAPHPSSSKGESALAPCLASSFCSQGGFLSPSYVPHHALSATALPQPAQAEGRAAPDLPDPTWSPPHIQAHTLQRAESTKALPLRAMEPR